MDMEREREEGCLNALDTGTVQQANLLKAVFEAMTEKILVYDVHGNMLQINAAARDFFGLGSEASCIGLPYQQFVHLYEICDDYCRALPIEQLPMSRVLRGEVLSGAQGDEFGVRLPSGREVEMSVSSSAVYDQQGGLIGGVSVFRDVTEHQRKDRCALQTLHSLLTLVEELVQIPEPAGGLLGEETPIATPTIEVVGKRLAELISQVLGYNHVAFVSCGTVDEQLRLVGVSGVTAEEEQRYREEVEQSSLLDYVGNASVARLQANETVVRDLVQFPFERPSNLGMERLLAAPMFIGPQLVGVVAIDKSESAGEYTPEEIMLVKAAAKLTGLVLERVRILNEWAETHASELALQDANRRFDIFLSIASHELRTPLTTIKGNVQLALRRLDVLKRQWAEQEETLINNVARVHQPLQYAIERVNVQDRLISDLLDASRIRANKIQLVMRPCNLVEIVRKVVEDQQQVATDRVIVLQMPLAEHVPIVGDADRIGQVVGNYLTNALKYSPADQPVIVRLEIEGEMARVSVRDEGPGLSPEDQERVWGRFYRAQGVEVQYGSGVGLGLGLYICHMLIESHHGQVGVSSVQGQGSTFWFTLPLAPGV